MSKSIKVSIRHLYKIFGGAPRQALAHVHAGMHKTQLLKETGHVLGLNDINIDMREGEITVIMGLSGSGKSTLIRHLNRLIEPTAGEVLIDGRNILGLDEAGLRALQRKTLSMVFQKFGLLPHRTVLDNVGLPLATQGMARAEWESEAIQWLSRVGLDGYAGHYPHQLSGGMQQRVGIARALTSNASIMLMDEAFSALDPLIRTDMQDLLVELQNELHKTIVFITHDLDEALKLADHLVILKDGVVVQQGEPQEILLAPAEPYVEDFISDVNLARVLKVHSVMERRILSDALDGEIEHNSSLECALAMSEGNINKRYLVTENGTPTGSIDMSMIIKAFASKPGRFIH
ncbi:glycine betaine/L-proline ABC transporter ATP-binding protein [Paracoccus sp. TOH]|uniref:quaternary amine ABC transporter ATP-binding protein n=1 Tax=Paracoccus sp. TOH TaxID=1263728 RepID=UPI0025B1CF11|nr:glycine betaine/L-proline ABC transporter ATP-binding protein [Paracoccus sp. TOH]WJS84389.1 glycine betaine/L-proline ABC transporter ATP-binding protein [Paracoccus sp. TOH]